jgi:hypothetical protein
MANNTRVITGDIAPIPQPKKAKTAPVVQAIEPVKGDWTQNNNWAFTLDKRSGWPAINTPPSIFSVAQCPVFRGPPRVRGILMTRDDIYINGSYGSGNLEIAARITYGAGGLSQQLLLDWGPTTVVNLPASNIVVEAIVTGQNEDGGNLFLGGVLSVCFSNELIPKVGYTTYTQTVSFGPGASVEIPPFATGFIMATLEPTALIAAFSTGNTGNAAAVYYLGQIFWLPTKAAYLVSSELTSAVISWVLSV